MAINISARYKLFFKWTVLVWLNAAVSFAMAIISEHNNYTDIAGIIFGVFTFVGIYTALDYYLIKIQAIKLRKTLFNAVLLKTLTQFYPAIEMLTGIVSMEFIKKIDLDSIPFLSTYLITLTDGLLLSIVVSLFLLIIKFITFVIRRFKYKNTQSIDN